MKHIALFVASIALATCFAASAHAQEFHRNAYGMYAAPTIYGFSKGSDYDLGASNAGLDLGAYYSRSFTSSFSARLELRYGTRAMDDLVTTNLFPGSFGMVRLEESILEVPLILMGDRRVSVGEHELRISAGGGVSTKFVLDQKLLGPQGEESGKYGIQGADSYRKVGILLDGGTTFSVDRRSAVFLRFRLDVDIATAGEPADASVIRRFWATGFYAGFEYGF